MPADRRRHPAGRPGQRGHRALLAETLQAKRADNRRRDWMAFAIIFAGLLVSAVMAYVGSPWLSGAILATHTGLRRAGVSKAKTQQGRRRIGHPLLHSPASRGLFLTSGAALTRSMLQHESGDHLPRRILAQLVRSRALGGVEGVVLFDARVL